MDAEFQADIATVGSIDAVPQILDIVCKTTGMGFAAVARVTESRWICCAVRDDIQFGLQPGGELKIETTLCNEIRQSQKAIVIDHVAKDQTFSGHPTPAMYGFQSYISMPIIRADGTMFGTLCAIDPKPARVDTPEVIGTFKLFAELIAFHLDAVQRAQATEVALIEERRRSQLREQFIAVMGHDLRNPLASISAGTNLLRRPNMEEKRDEILDMMSQSVSRMAGLIDNVMDVARARLGGGLTIDTGKRVQLAPALNQVVEELRSSNPNRTIETDFALPDPIPCDSSRIAQLLSNLLGNAITHGARNQPIVVRAASDGAAFALSVTNGGPPIPPAEQERLFLPFAQGAPRPNEPGLGLGLYIASEIAKAHGGTLDVASNAEATCFTFRMPLDRAQRH